MTTEFPRRPGPSVRRRVVEHRQDAAVRHEDRLATEEPLEIRLASPGVPATRAWVTMRTPGHDFELAAGWVLHEGLADPAGITRVAYCTDSQLAPEQEFNVVTVSLAHTPRLPHRHDTAATGSSACGVCGKESIDAVTQVSPGPRWTGARLDADAVRRLPERLRTGQALFERTGGVHAAGLATAAGEVVAVREDVGRHNAVDKVVGSRVLAGASPSAAALVVSGRAGFELVQKAVASGMGALVSVGAPTSLAADLASAAGLDLWGFASPERVIRYS